MLGMLIHKNGLPQILMILSYCMFTVKVVIYGGEGGDLHLSYALSLKPWKLLPPTHSPCMVKKSKLQCGKSCIYKFNTKAYWLTIENVYLTTSINNDFFSIYEKARSDSVGNVHWLLDFL